MTPLTFGRSLRSSAIILVALTQALVASPAAGQEGCADAESRRISLCKQLRVAQGVAEKDLDEILTVQQQRDHARDKIWGPTGSLAKYFVQLGTLAATADKAFETAGKLFDAISKIQSGAEWYEHLERMSAQYYQYTGGPVGIVSQPTRELQEIVDKANRWVQEGGSEKEAIELLQQDLESSIATRGGVCDTIKKLAKGEKNAGGESLSPFVTVCDYHAATEGLANDIQTYLVHRRTLQEHEASVDEMISKIQAAGAGLRELRSNCGVQPGCAGAEGILERLRALPRIDWQAPEDAVAQRVSENIHEIEGNLKVATERLYAVQGAYLSPLMLRAYPGLSRELQKQLLLNLQDELSEAMNQLTDSLSKAVETAKLILGGPDAKVEG